MPQPHSRDRPYLGERENKQLDVVKAHGIRNVHLYESEDWVDVQDVVGDLTKKFLCLNAIYPKGVLIPKRFIGENIIHLPTIKTHVFTTMTGAMKNAFGGLLTSTVTGPTLSSTKPWSTC